MITSLPAAQMILAALIWLLAIFGRVLGAEPFVSWLYFFAWWPLLLFLDGLLGRLTGRSFIWERPGDFLRMLFFSVTVWLTFEVFNLYLLNWRYVGVEHRLWLRWPGYALSFATVLPGVLLSAQVLAALGVGANLKGRSHSLGNWQPLFLLIGVACLILPFLAPHYAFPLIWLAFIFLLDPFLDLLTGDSLTRRFWPGNAKSIFVFSWRAWVRPLVGNVELSQFRQMGLYSAGAQFRQNLRNAHPGIFGLSALCPGVRHHV